MSERLLLSPDHQAHYTEFIKALNGKLLNGDCVEYAMIFALACVLNRMPTEHDLAVLVSQMQARGIAATNGATSINEAHQWLVEQHYAIAAYVGYSEPFAGDWKAIVRAYKGKAPMVMNIARAGHLPGDESGVQYHGIAIIGDDDAAPNVLICADGDSDAATTSYQRYTFDDLDAAQPCGLIVLAMPTTPKPVPAPMPSGWHDDGTTVTANGYQVTQGFRTYLLSNRWLGSPISRAWDDAGSSYQLFTYGMLVWRGSGAVFAANVGENLLKGVLPTVPDAAKQPNKA